MERGNFKQMNCRGKMEEVSGYVSEHFGTYKVKFMVWSIVHLETGRPITNLSSKTALEAKARIAKLEETYDWDHEYHNLMGANGFETPGDFESEVLNLLKPVTAKRGDNV